MFFDYFKQQANLSNRGAMETGDHFKNGASPKSLMNRGKYFNVLIRSSR
jgi:hypothetical protein